MTAPLAMAMAPRPTPWSLAHPLWLCPFRPFFALAMLSAWLLMGLWGGFFAAALLAVSIEGLPIVALFAALAALRWALQARAADRDRLCGYLGALASGAILLQFVTRGPVGLTGTWCDSLSAPYVAAFVAAAAATFSVSAPRSSVTESPKL